MSRFQEAFESAWKRLFETPIHLDSLLSKQDEDLKRPLARAFHLVLRRPASLSKKLKIKRPTHVPWGKWNIAKAFAAKLESFLDQNYESLEQLPFDWEDFPPDLVSELNDSYGESQAQKVLEALSQQAPTSLRVYSLGGREPEAVLLELKKECQLGKRIRFSQLVARGIRIEGYAPVLNTELFRSGAFEIQDEGSQVMALFSLEPGLVSGLLSVFPGEHPPRTILKDTADIANRSKVASRVVIDACAGAGGKSLALADALRGQGKVFAYDISEKKLMALRRRAKRAGLHNIQTVCISPHQEKDQIKTFKKKADVVLVDAPCSGWGVLRRNPDIKWPKQTLEQPKEDLLKLQARLLDAYSELVKTGGRLVYGVCTFREPETTEQVQAFSQAHPEFVMEAGGFLGPHSSDGFFMQSWIKR